MQRLSSSVGALQLIDLPVLHLGRLTADCCGEHGQQPSNLKARARSCTSSPLPSHHCCKPALFLQAEHPASFPPAPHLAVHPPPTFTARQGPAPHPSLCAADGHIPDRSVAILAAVVHPHSTGKPVQGLSTVQPIGNVRWPRTRHLWRGRGKAHESCLGEVMPEKQLNSNLLHVGHREGKGEGQWAHMPALSDRPVVSALSLLWLFWRRNVEWIHKHPSRLPQRLCHIPCPCPVPSTVTGSAWVCCSQSTGRRVLA